MSGGIFMHISICPHCKNELTPQSGAVFCPFCGAALTATGQEPPAVLALITRIKDMKDVCEKHRLLLHAQDEHPESLAIAQELLFMGRLHERNSKNIDFSVIKCHLLKMYLDPKDFSPEQQAVMRQELFHHPQLLRCQTLSADPDAYCRQYLLRLCREFIQLFLRGDSRYMRRFFGIGIDSMAPKLLAAPLASMLTNIYKDTQLLPRQQEMLYHQLYQAFLREMAGDTKYLDERLQQMGFPIEDEE